MLVRRLRLLALGWAPGSEASHGTKGDGIETQVGCPGRWSDQKKRSDQQRGQASHNSNQAWFVDAIRV